MPFILPLLATAAIAAEPPITVTATRAPIALAELGASVTILSGERIEQLQSSQLLEILPLTPGLTLSRNGGAGGFAAVRIRGAEGEQTTVVIDGVKTADPAAPGGGYDFANLSSAHIARVEILRGPQSLAWGSQAIGGVINIITAEPTEEWQGRARAEGGSRNGWLARGDVSGKAGPVALSVGGNWQKTDGISAFSEDRGGIERDDYESYGANARADIALGEQFALDLRGRYQRASFGIDGFPPPFFSFSDTPDRSRSRELTGYAGVRFASADDRVTARAGWQISDIDRENSTPGKTPEATFLSTGRAERLDAQVGFAAASWLDLQLGAEREISRLKTASPSSFDPDSVPDQARAQLWGGWLQAVLRPMEGLTMLAGVRHDDHDRFGGATTLGGSLSYAPGNGPTRLKASVGQGFKAPTLFQLFSDFGNQTLKPERATGYDVGVETRALEGALVASATWFGRTSRDQIDFVSCFGVSSPICTGRPFGTYDNIARTQAKGVELVLGMRPTAGLTVDANYTWTDARNRSETSANFDKRLPRRAEHSVSLIGDWVAKAGWSVGATLRHVSDSFDNAANTRRLGGYVLADIRAAVPVASRFEVYGRVTNLFDERYETVRLYGQPGRAFALGVRASL